MENIENVCFFNSTLRLTAGESLIPESSLFILLPRINTILHHLQLKDVLRVESRKYDAFKFDFIMASCHMC